ncbi:hypothetical protein F5141DRAFT_1112331 [Pisolithus sp. B1]|nr:hypothetical protein F5141DRAFT_1112331 [Pisolithus sp. B1]
MVSATHISSPLRRLNIYILSIALKSALLVPAVTQVVHPTPHPGGRGNAPSVSGWSRTRLVACLLHHLRTTVNQKRKTAGRVSMDCPRQVGVRGLYGDVKIEADKVMTPV